MDTELGSMFNAPNGFPWSDYGLYVGATARDLMLNRDALREHYSHFNHFGPWDEQLGFPYTALRQYEAQEVAAGRPPIFVTATYQGKKRPVLYLTYLDLNGGIKPNTSPVHWVYAVNVQDERFIKFWINRFARPSILEPMSQMRNVWPYFDGCEFEYAAYGVIDDSGRWVGGVRWDPPFPQTPDEYLQSVETFFARVKQLAPDMKFMTDIGHISDPTQIQTVYANIQGALAEDVYAWYTDRGQRVSNFYNQIFPWFSWLGDSGRVGVMEANIPPYAPANALLSSFVTYELLKGQNFFFAPRYVNANGTGSTPAPPGSWEHWNAALGTPVSDFQQGPQQSGGNVSSRLYSRQYSTGYVYLNWTSTTQTVTLPPGEWFDPNENPVKQISIPPSAGTFVSSAGASTTTAKPRISPRTEYTITSPVTVTIQSPTTNTTIHYSVDGSTPTASSPLYSAPFELQSSTVVKAKAFHSGYNPSDISAVAYTITSGPPTVQFITPSDSGPATGPASTNTYYPVLALSAASTHSIDLTYTIVDPKGNTTSGSTAFLSGELYRQIPVSVPGSGTWRISISNANGAVLGSTAVFEYSKN